MVNAKDYICCCGLRIWTRVIGWLGLIGCIFAVLGVIGLAAGEDGDGQPNDSPGLIIVALGVIVAIALVVQILLLVGNEKEKPAFLTTWLTSAWISVVLLVLGVLGLTFTGAGFGKILMSVCQLITTGYAILVVHQRRKEIRENGYVQEEPGV